RNQFLSADRLLVRASCIDPPHNSKYFMTNNNVTAARKKMLPGWLIVLGALTAIGPLSIDMYLPSFPTIANNFSVGINLVQLTLASFLVGLAVGQMFYGPLSDRFGRKPPLYFGLGLYTLA